MTIPPIPEKIQQLNQKFDNNITAEDPFSGSGAVADFSPWSWFYNLIYKIRMPLSAEMVIINLNDESDNPLWHFKYGISLVKELLRNYHGIFMKAEYTKIKEKIKDLDNIFKLFIKENRLLIKRDKYKLPETMVNLFEEIVEYLYLYQQFHGLNLPTSQNVEAAYKSAFKEFEGG